MNKKSDKIELSFKVSDLVVRNDILARILNIQEQYYLIQKIKKQIIKKNKK